MRVFASEESLSEVSAILWELRRTEAGRRLKLELGPNSTFLSRRLVTCSHLIILCFVFFFCFAFLFIDPHTHMISRVNAKLTVIHCHVVFRLKTMA